MIHLLIFSQVFLFSNQNKYIDNNEKLSKEIFIEDLSSYNVSIFCLNNNSKSINFIGRLKNIKYIKNNNKYKLYSSRYINDKIDENRINKYQNSTSFLINFFKKFNKEKLFLSKTNNSNYCLIRYNDYYFALVGKEMNEKYKNLIKYILILFSIASFFMFCLYRCFYSPFKLNLDIIHTANLYISFCFPLSLSCIFFGSYNIISLIYSLYKSIMIVNLIYYLTGYKIIYFQETIGKNIKIIILIFLIESSSTIVFLFLDNFIPFFDSFYLFFARNSIEHFIIFVIGVKMFLTNFINLYRLYRLERRIRTILTLVYKYKIIIYSKIFIFAFLYSIGFIAIKIIQLYYNINDDNEGIIYIYYMDISLEIFFALIFGIIFFPLKHSFLFFFETNNDINIYFLTEIKKDTENNLQIKNLKKNILEEIYIKEEYPLVLLEPFTKIDNLLNDCHLHIGIVNKKKEFHKY